MAPKISVVIAVYNRADFIRPCLESVLNQTVEDFEVLLIDDGSTDGTPEILQGLSHPRVRVHLHSQNKGLMFNRNFGAQISRGEYVLYTDSDCTVAEDWVEIVLKAFRKDPSIAMVGTSIRDGEDSNYWSLVNKGINTYWGKGEGYVSAVGGGSMAIKRSLLLAYPFDETFKYGADDLEMCYKLGKLGHKIYFTDQTYATHYHRNNFRSSLAQQFHYGVTCFYVRLRYWVWPVFNYATFVLLSCIISAILGWSALSIFFLIAYGFIVHLLNTRSKVKTLREALLTYPGYIVIFTAFCAGMLVSPIGIAIRLFRKRDQRAH